MFSDGSQEQNEVGHAQSPGLSTVAGHLPPACNQQADGPSRILRTEEPDGRHQRLQSLETVVVSDKEENDSVGGNSEGRPSFGPVEITVPRVESVEVNGVEDNGDLLQRLARIARRCSVLIIREMAMILLTLGLRYWRLWIQRVR